MGPGPAGGKDDSQGLDLVRQVKDVGAGYETKIWDERHEAIGRGPILPRYPNGINWLSVTATTPAS
jgi:hypothetical protein